MTTTTAETADEYQSARPSKPMEIALAAVALAFSVTYLAMSTMIVLRREAAPGQIDARFWPGLIGTIAVAVAVVLLVIAITRPPENRDDLERIQPGGLLRVVLTLAISGAFVWAWSFGSIILFGYRFVLFPIATAVLLVALMLVYGHRKWISLVIYTASLTAFIYVIFGMLLRIPL